jgi:hypothetical protein
MLNIQGIVVPEFYGSNQEIDVPCPIIGPDEIDKIPCIAMEYTAGEDLFDYKIAHRNKLPILAKVVKDCCMQIARTGVPQEDPKLDGVIVVADTHSSFTIRVIDFSHVTFDGSDILKMGHACGQFIMRRYLEILDWKMPQDVETWGKDEPESAASCSDVPTTPST